jgi:DHA2 family metal-tetracycline-proton antiporter-like MFS transporter
VGEADVGLAGEVGVVLLPGAVLTAVAGVAAGWLVDRVGARPLAQAGLAAMLLALLGLSTYAGNSLVMTSVFAGLLGAGFSLVNTPLATAVSRVVRMRRLASAMNFNSMLFFIGGSFGAAVLIGIVTAGGADSLNPIHSGPGAPFSDAFLFLGLAIVVAMALSAVLSSAEKRPAVSAQPAEAASSAHRQDSWRPDCSMGWAPDAAEAPGPRR